MDYLNTKPVLLYLGDFQRFVCNNCGRSYKYKKGLTQHQRLECGKEPKFVCPFCPYKAKQKVALTSHVFCKHNNSTIQQS